MHHRSIQQPDQGTQDPDALKAQINQLERTLSALKARLPSDAPEQRSRSDHHLNEETIQRILKARRTREQQLGSNLFSDPAWDILLEAFSAELAQVKTSVSGLCFATPVPNTTALRWIRKLEEDGWLFRVPDRLDARRHWMELTPAASQRLRRYFRTIRPDVLPI